MRIPHTPEKEETPVNILHTADLLTSQDRNKQYGSPSEDFARTARLWSTILGVEVTPTQVGLCQIMVKASRLCHSYKEDTLVDIAGYARCIQMVETNK